MPSSSGPILHRTWSPGLRSRRSGSSLHSPAREIIEHYLFRISFLSYTYNDTINTAKGFDGFLDAALAVVHFGVVALDHGRFDAVGGLDFFGEVLGGLLGVGVIDGDVGAFGGEFAGDFGAETSV